MKINCTQDYGSEIVEKLFSQPLTDTFGNATEEATEHKLDHRRHKGKHECPFQLRVPVGFGNS